MENIFKEIFNSEWKNDLYTIWALIKKHLSSIIIAVFCALIFSIINGSIAWLVKPALDNLFVEKNQTLLILLPVGVFLLFVLRGFFSFFNNYLMNLVGAKIVKSLRQAAYEKLLRLPIPFYSEKSSGSVISRLLNDIKVIETLIPYTAKNLLVQSSTVVLLSIVALFRRWDLALLSFIVIPLIALVSEKFGRRMKSTSAVTMKLISNITELIQETISGIKVIKSFTIEREMSRQSKEAVSAHYKNILQEVKINELTSSVIEIIAGSGVAIILWYGSYLILNNQLSVGSFFSFIAAVLMIYTPLKRLSQVNNNFQKIRTALHRIKELFILEDEPDGKFIKEDIEGYIRYNNVSFRYPGSKEPALKEINLNIMPGETVAIVGHSGAGKSTLVDLLLAFWNDYTGDILIDGMNLKDYSLHNIRSHIGVVSQDITLFNDTVMNNILFGKQNSSKNEVIDAAKAAYAHHFIKEMPLGYNSIIGEQGVKLSGGQKQRISLARAIIKNPKILILDEATSSLDTESEHKIQKALEDIMIGRTTIIIAHRLSTIKKSNRIIVLKNGRIIQQGKHIELSSKEGVYQELYNIPVKEPTSSSLNKFS